jgi:hypothetical protein
MRRVVLVAGLLATVLPLHAQPKPATTPVSASAVRDAMGGSIVFRNQSDRVVTGIEYIYTMRNPDATVLYAATGYYDCTVDPQNQPPIQPGQEVRVAYRIPFTNAVPVIGVDAVIYADGSSFGERQMVRAVLDRRGYTLISLNKAIADLKQAAKDGTTRAELINQFQTEGAVQASNAADSELANCIQMVRGDVIAGLIRSARRPDGTPVPMSESIQSLIDKLSVRREILRAAVAPK